MSYDWQLSEAREGKAKGIYYDDKMQRKSKSNIKDKKEALI